MPSKARSLALIVGASSALCAVFTTTARAQIIDQEDVPAPPPPPAPFVWRGQIAVEGQAGYGTPLGYLGLAVDADLLPWLSLSAGLGSDMFEVQYLSLYVNHVVVRQMALMPRLQFPVFDDATFLTLGAGVSRDAGPHTQTYDGALVRQDDELGIEHRFENGIRLRAFAGIGYGLNESSRSAYAGAALGYAVVPNPEHSAIPAAGAWYGWQLLLSDVVAATVAAEGGSSHEAARAGLAIYAVTPAVIHVAHHNYGRAMLSAALRTTLLYMAVHVNDNSPGSEYDANTGEVIAIAAALAALIDDVALGWQ